MEKFLKLPKVSFIVISHNFEKFILDCLNSIKEQTYTNFEIIIADDCSEDNTAANIEKFIYNNRDLDIKFIKNQKNKGQLSTFLTALKEASGEFVCQIDGDDVLFPDYAVKHVEVHMKTSVALTSCQHVDIDSDNTVHSFASIECPQNLESKFKIESSTEQCLVNCFIKPKDDEDYDVKVLSNKKYNFATWHWAPASSGMMRKSACDMLLLLKNPEDIKITSDKFVFSFLHLIGSSALIYKPLYAYRKHGTNYSLANPVMGSHRYLKSDTQKNYIRNNRLIRQVMFKFITDNYKVFEEKFNKANVRLILKRIIFSFDAATLKSVLKSFLIW